MNYKEYKNEVKNIFQEMGYTKQETEKYFATTVVKDLLKSKYSYINHPTMKVNVTPAAVASTLDLMY